MVRIPSEYQEVEYIESTGTQWIDTGYIPVLSPILRMKIRVTDKQDRDIAGFISNVYPSFIIDSAPAQSRWYNRYGDTAAYGVNPGPVIGQIQEWEWGKEVKFNGNLMRTNTECDWSSNTQKMNIFSGRNKAFVAIYSCSLYDGELVRNLIPCYRKSDGEIGMYDTVSKTFFTNQGTRTFLKGNDVNYDTVNLMESRRRILLNTPHLESLSGSMLSFKTDMASKLKECKIHFTPIQEGTGDPSPDNVRLIHGWDGVTVGTRNNFIDASTYTWTSRKFLGRVSSGYSDSCDGTALSASSSYRMILEFLPCSHLQGNHIAIYPRLSSSAYAGIAFYTDANEESYIADSAFHAHGNVPNNARYMRVCALNAHDFLHFTISKTTSGSINAVVPYDGIFVPFPQTIYGGYVDLVKGEVVEEWAKWVEDGSRTPSYWVWQKDDTNAVYTALMPALPEGSRHNPNFGFIEKVMCPNRHCVGINSAGVRTPNIISLYRAQNSASFAYSFTGEEFSSMTKEELKAYIAENPIESVYILLTPRTYSLDPVTLRTLKGLNNIWSDANGNIELKFWTH